MAKDNKQLYAEFLKNHPELSREQAYQKYTKEYGGHIRKQTAHQIAREVMGDIQKGEQRKAPVIYRKEYTPPLPKIPKEPKPKKTKPPKIPKTQGFFKVNDSVYRDINSPAVSLLKKHINTLMGNPNTNSFLKVGLKVDGDKVTQKQDAYFGIMIPEKQIKKRMGVRTFAKKLHKNIKIYYTNLSKLYGEKNSMVNTINNHLSQLDGEIQNIKTKEDLYNTFGRHGFDITDMHHFSITNNRGIDEEDFNEDDLE